MTLPAAPQPLPPAPCTADGLELAPDTARQFIEQARLPMFIKDRSGRYLHVNEAYERLSRLPRAEVLGRRMDELYPPLMAARLQADDERVWRHGGPLAFDEALQIDGRLQWRRAEKFLLSDASGRPWALAGLSVDITELRTGGVGVAPDALLQLAFDAILTWRWDGAIEGWNRGAERLYGYTEAEALGRRPHELLHTRYPLALQELQHRLRDHGEWSGEVVQVLGDGRELVVATRLQRFRGPDHADRVLQVDRDVTEAHRSRAALEARERELRAAQMRLEAALAAAHMNVWELTPNSDEGHWWGPTYATLGLGPATPGEPGVGARYREFMHPADRAGVEAALARAILDRSEFRHDYRLVLPGGDVRWFTSRASYLKADEAGPERLLGVNIDITERKAVEQALRDTDERRTEFLAMLAHELRNPLAPIANAVRLLERADGRQELREMATQIIQRQSAHLARLVDDLLEVSRVTRGRIELRKENLLLATVVLSAVETVRPLVREQQQTLQVDVPTDIDLVADPARMVQIIANLLNNAAKYTPKGGELRVCARADDAGWVEVEVSDNGIGIGPELLPQVFELFRQGETALDRARGGLGIGLSVVKSLVELHGGTVRAASAGPNQGACFTVRLPREERRTAPRTPVTGLPVRRIPPTTVLVADDNRDAAESMAMLLEADGHRVRIAEDGDAALAAAREFRPRVVLLDLGMPQRDGYAVAQALRADPAFEQVVLVALSGYGQASDRARSQAAGFDAHLLKPADLSQVYEVIADGWQRRRG